MMLDSLYGNLLGLTGPAAAKASGSPAPQVSPAPKGAAGGGDDMFSGPPPGSMAKDAAKEEAPVVAPTCEPRPQAQAFSAAKLMMPPVRKKAEPGKKPVPALDIIKKLQEEKEALMRQKAAKASVTTPPVVSGFTSAGLADGKAASGFGGAETNTPMSVGTAGGVGTAGTAAAALSSLYGSPDEEYDPAKPNDYDEFCRRRARLKAEEEMERRRQEQLARQQQATKAVEPPKEDDFATRMMKKMGWKEGAGLGKDEQGIANPLVLKKTDRATGTIVEGTSMKRDAPPAQVAPAKKPAVSRPPTRVLLLNNMVGAGDVDEDLEEETGEEAGKYGKLVKCVIKEVKGVPDDQAVRIFLQYEQVEGATKALVDMNGRYFGGRVVKARFFDEERFAKGDLDIKDGE